MRAKKIMFPTDFSRSSETALEYATVLARESGATLIIVHAEEPPVVGGDILNYGFLIADSTECQEALNRIVPTDPTVPFEHHLLQGTSGVAEQIDAFAKKENIDLIVLGTHGRTGLSRVFMGSVAELVLRHAPCPVLAVRDGITQASLAI